LQSGIFPIACPAPPLLLGGRRGTAMRLSASS